MTGVIENMPAEARQQRLQALAEVLREIVRAADNSVMRMADALSAAAAKLRTAISQIKQGLNYALSHSLLRLSPNDELSLA